MKPLAALRVLILFAFAPMMACAHSPQSAGSASFDDCLITHMAAISMLEDASSEDDVALRDAVIKSQTMLLADDTLEDDALAQRTSTLLQSYGRAAERAAAEAYANGVTPADLAADAISCEKELRE